MVDADLNAVAFNERFLELLDFSPGMFKPSDPYAKFIRYNAERGEYGPGDIEELVRSRVELTRKFEPHRLERTRPDGVTIEIRGNPVATGGFVTTYTDITARRQAEASMVSFFEPAPIPMALTRRSNGEIIMINRRGAELSGATVEELIGRHTSTSFVNPRDAKRLVEEARATGRIEDFEAPIRTRNGREIQVLAAGQVIDYEGAPALLVGYYDITERKQTEGAMISVFESAPIPMVLTRGRSGEVLRINQRAAELQNVTVEEAVVSSESPPRQRSGLRV